MKKSKLNPELLKILVAVVLLVLSFAFNDFAALRFILLIIAYSIVSYKTYFHAFHDIKEGEIFNESILMIIATLGAFCIKEYPEAVVVMILYQVGELLSDRAIDKSVESITTLLDFSSPTIHLLKNGKISTIDVKEAKEGDIFIVKQGEKIPLDGVVLEGCSSVDTSSLTGESIPKVIKPSYKVLSGTINLTNIITVKATSEYSNTTTTKIIEMIENSSSKKARMEKFITKFSRVYTPIVVLIAILLTVIPTVVFNQELSVWIYRSLELLVISCPCALVISIPLAFFCGIGRASKEGILIKGNKELDYLNSIDALVLDKTGTITKGAFSVTKINSVSTISNTKVLEIAAHMEFYSNHPIAKSIVNKYNNSIDEDRIKEYKEKPGFGITCKIDDEIYYLGNVDLLTNHDITPMDHGDDMGTIIYLANNEKCLGYILISDVIKKEAYFLRHDLNELGIKKIVMLSGDDEKIVSKVASEIDIREYYGNLLPIDKVNKLKELKGKYNCAFVGDGINDAPVIKIADIGISMGSIGSDAAIEASDIVIMKDDLSGITNALFIAKYTRKIIIFNIALSLLFKLIVMILAIFGVTSMWMAIFADVGVTLLTVLNSLRIFNKHI